VPGRSLEDVVYVVERYLPGIAPEELALALERLAEAVAQLRAEGMQMRYLGSTIVPEDEACFCQFEAWSEADVAAANRRAGIPFDRIVEALAVAPAAGGRGEEP
jgi:Protein of unknown function (DUF4242)